MDSNCNNKVLDFISSRDHEISFILFVTILFDKILLCKTQCARGHQVDRALVDHDAGEQQTEINEKTSRRIFSEKSRARLLMLVLLFTRLVCCDFKKTCYKL